MSLKNGCIELILHVSARCMIVPQAMKVVGCQLGEKMEEALFLRTTSKENVQTDPWGGLWGIFLSFRSYEELEWGSPRALTESVNDSTKRRKCLSVSSRGSQSATGIGV